MNKKEEHLLVFAILTYLNPYLGSLSDNDKALESLFLFDYHYFKKYKKNLFDYNLWYIKFFPSTNIINSVIEPSYRMNRLISQITTYKRKGYIKDHEIRHFLFDTKKYSEDDFLSIVKKLKNEDYQKVLNSISRKLYKKKQLTLEFKMDKGLVSQ